MRRVVLPLAAAVAAAALTATATASPSKSARRWESMTPTAKMSLLTQTIRSDRGAVRWWLTNRPTPDEPLVYLHIDPLVRPPLCPSIGIRAPATVCARAARLNHARAVLRVIDARLEAARVAAEEARRLAALPAHLALWRCIEVGESHGDGTHPGDQNASNGTHFNVLQMTDPWGSQKLHPIGLPYDVIEMEAEREYERSNYSSSWLQGQWGQTIGGCWSHA